MDLLADFSPDLYLYYRVNLLEKSNLASKHCTHPAFKESGHYANILCLINLNVKMVKDVSKHGRNITKYIRYIVMENHLYINPKNTDKLFFDHSDTKVTRYHNQWRLDT